jgi:flagellar motor switch/type III secretory pathway protein FliN
MSAIVPTMKEVAPGISDELWSEAGWLPCSLSVDLKLQRFTVKDLLRLEPGAILETKHVNGADVPVLVNTQVIGWAEFEVVAQRIAVRITELA